MTPSIASLICAIGIAGLLYLDRDKTARTSKALWIPALWIGLIGSRPLTVWMGFAPSNELNGNPVDAAALGLLLAGALAILIGRRKRTQTLLKANWPMLLYFAFCLISVAWSDYPDIALKRWVKAIGDLAIVLIVITDPQPITAIRRVVSRTGMVLLPMSLLFIRYYGDLGRAYTADGLLTNIGVTTNKNALGLIVLVVSLVALWNANWLWNHKDEPNRLRRLLTQGVLLAFGLWLLVLANSSTAKACFAIGGFLIFALNRPFFKTRPARVHVLWFALVVGASLALLTGDVGAVAHGLGRESNLSGRTAIWAAVIPTVPNSVVGAGFESFWISPNVRAFKQTLINQGWYPPVAEELNEAHNGYIEVYLNLGWIGVCLIALVLIEGYRRAVMAYRQQPELATLFLAYTASAVFYSITEAGFRMLNPSWTFLILAIFGSSSITAGFVHAEESASNALLIPALAEQEPSKSSPKTRRWQGESFQGSGNYDPLG